MWATGHLKRRNGAVWQIGQECAEGVLRWIDKPSGNEAADHLGAPAPALTLLPRQP